MGIDMQQPAVPLSITITIISHDGGLNKTMVYPNVYDFDMSQQPLEDYLTRDPELTTIPPRSSIGSAFELGFKAKADPNGVHTIVSNNLLSKPDLEMVVPGFSTNGLLRMAEDYRERMHLRKAELVEELATYGEQVFLDFLESRGFRLELLTKDDEENNE